MSLLVSRAAPARDHLAVLRHLATSIASLPPKRPSTASTPLRCLTASQAAKVSTGESNKEAQGTAYATSSDRPSAT
jgi:hypothetical protein